jgi:hypothetical protein
LAEDAFDRTITGVPLWLLREYLVELGGRARANRVAGDGWRAELTQVEDYRIGSLAVGQVRLTVDGEAPALAALLPLLEKRLVRGGG